MSSLKTAPPLLPCSQGASVLPVPCRTSPPEVSAGVAVLGGCHHFLFPLLSPSSRLEQSHGGWSQSHDLVTEGKGRKPQRP